ncbi:hypothetical protein M3Y99_00467300 [Aphelenchoides fujianensis]|nr:hypothetical protein M3Y99_00467300 [Aphelenchoides fujianensis]
MLLLFSFLLLPLAWADTRLFNVRKLTNGGDHSYPRFSWDGKEIFFTAKGGPYESNCNHVYRMDLRTPAQPISLVSTGIGEERGVSFVVDLGMKTTRAVTATAGLSLLKQSSPSAGFTNDDFCQPSVCSQSGLSQHPHEERLPFSEPIAFDTNGFVRSTPQSKRSWEDAPMFAHNGDIRLSSKAGDRGEVLNFTAFDDVHLFNVLGWAGGWHQTDAFLFQGPALFHGASLGTDDQQSVKEGVIPLAQTSIYRTNQTTLVKNIFDLRSSLLVAPSFVAYTDPRFLLGDRNRFFYTQTDLSIGRSSVYFHDQNKEVLIRADARHADNTYSGNFNYVTFAAKDGAESDYQLYLATFDGSQQYPTYPVTPWPAVDSPSPYLKNAKNVYTTYEYGPRSIRISKDGNWAIFLVAYQPHRYQALQIDLRAGSSEVVRKLTIGDGFFSSPCFLSDKGGEGDILVVSSITNSKASCRPLFFHSDCLGSTTDVCNERVCTSMATGDLKELCKNVIEEHFLSPRNEIFRVNPFGTIKQRLTDNDAYEGELAVSTDGIVVYSSNRDGADYELYLAHANSMLHPTAITNKLGFEGGVQFSPDGKWIAYFAWRPQTEEQKALYRKWLSFNTIDLGGDYQLYAMSMDDLQEIQLTTFSTPSLARIRLAFNAESTALFFQRGREFYGYKSLESSEQFDDFAFGPDGTFFASNLGDLLSGDFDPQPGDLQTTTKGAPTAEISVLLLSALFLPSCE